MVSHRNETNCKDETAIDVERKRGKKGVAAANITTNRLETARVINETPALP